MWINAWKGAAKVEINEMILVINNNKGTETNYLMTFEDYKRNLDVKRFENKEEIADIIMELGRTLADDKKWAEISYSGNKTVSARFCKDEHQLVAFLHGKFNNDNFEWTYEKSASSAECDMKLEVLGIDSSGCKKSGDYTYMKIVTDFKQGDILKNFNGSTYRVIEVLKKRDLVLMNVDTGKFMVGLGTRMYERVPKGMPDVDEYKLKCIEWDNGIYLSATPSDIDFKKLKEDYVRVEIKEPDGIKEYHIEIKEELARVEKIEAETLGDAIDKAMDMYYGQDIILDAGDMKNVDFKPYEDKKIR